MSHQSLHEECLLAYLQEKTSQTKMAPTHCNELEALKPIYRRQHYVSFPIAIFLQKIKGLLS